MIYLKLYISFFKIGITSFGGMSMIPLILDEMKTNGWMTLEDLTNLLAIAEMTPGPLGLNSAVFAGLQSVGIMGSIIALLGVLTPTLTITLGVAICFVKFKGNTIMNAVLSWVKPICVSMIFAIILSLSYENYLTNNKPDILSICIGILVFILLKKRLVSIPVAIIISAILGILNYGIL